MEQICFSITGVIILLAALWFSTALFRIWRSPRKLLKEWKKLTPEDLSRLSLLCESFFREELHLKLNRENFTSCVPVLLGIFPEGVHRLKGYLLYGAPSGQGNKLSPLPAALYRQGEYFHGFSSILLASFICESLRISCGGRWCAGPGGLAVQLPGDVPGEDIIFSPAEKLAEFNNIASQNDKERFEDCLLELCARTQQAVH